MNVFLLLLIMIFLGYSHAQMGGLLSLNGTEQDGKGLDPFPQFNWVITIENWLIVDVYIAETQFQCMQHGDVRKATIVARTTEGPGRLVFKTKEDSCLFSVRQYGTRGLVLAFKSTPPTLQFGAMYHYVEMRSWFATRLCNIYSSSRNFWADRSVLDSVVIGCGDTQDSSGTPIIEMDIRIKPPGPILEKSKSSRNRLPFVNHTMDIRPPVYGPQPRTGRGYGPGVELLVYNLSKRNVYLYMSKHLPPKCMEVTHLADVKTIKPSSRWSHTFYTQCGRDQISEFYYMLSFFNPNEVNKAEEESICFAVGYLAIVYKEGTRNFQRTCVASSGNTKPTPQGESMMFDTEVDYCRRGNEKVAEDWIFVTVWP